MATPIQPAKMTTAQKLLAMEALWESLRQTPDKVPSPAWHADVLRARVARVRRGRSRFRDWTDAKQRLRARVE